MLLLHQLFTPDMPIRLRRVESLFTAAERTGSGDRLEMPGAANVDSVGSGGAWDAVEYCILEFGAGRACPEDEEQRQECRRPLSLMADDVRKSALPCAWRLPPGEVGGGFVPPCVADEADADRFFHNGKC